MRVRSEVRSWNRYSLTVPGLATLAAVRLEHADVRRSKGWHLGPWNADLELSIGYATRGIDEPHVYSLVKEVYLVARGTAEIRVGSETVPLRPGDVLVVEPGEPHTFLSSSADYFHFVLHTPGVAADVAQAEKALVPRAALGL
jgi:mannose-6-phosphate isomerase-like protein (cupin superfamily)